MSLIDYRERMVVEQLLINATVQARTQEEAHNTFKRVVDYVVEKAGGVNVFRHNKFGNYDGNNSVMLRFDGGDAA